MLGSIGRKLVFNGRYVRTSYPQFADQLNRMAYLTWVAAVPIHQIEAIRKDQQTVLTPTLMKGVSHLLGYWVKLQPLGELLSLTIDGGELLNDCFWHPLRPPMVHQPPDVRSLAIELNREWETARRKSELDDEWLDSEMNRLIAVLTHARGNESAIVTALDLPADNERAQRVRIPWQPYSPLHGVPRRRWWMPWSRYG